KRDRECNRACCATAVRRSEYCPRFVPKFAQPADCLLRAAPCIAHNVDYTRERHRRPIDELRPQSDGQLSAGRPLCRPYPQEREAGESSGPAADQVRAVHQPDDRQGARDYRPVKCARPRRRGDRMTAKMKRREFITILGGAAAWPLAARAQQPMALVGLLTGVDLDDQRIGEIRQSLKDTGYVEGRNVAIKYRSAGGRLDRLPALGAELVADPVSVILTPAPPAALAAKAATGTIPIIFVTGADPVDLGLVSSFNRPGGNVTGISFVVHPLATKRLELLRE